MALPDWNRCRRSQWSETEATAHGSAQVRMPAGPGLVCSQCQRAVHTLCLAHPCLSALDLPQGCWVCPCCSQPNTLLVGPALPGPTACPLN